MKFESKAHMAQELAAGKRYSRQFFGDVIYFDSSKNDPFRVDSSKDKPYPVVGARMVSTWDDWDKDIWEEVNVHFELIKAYKSGKVIQYFSHTDGWTTLTNPSWLPETKYRVHPHSDLIQAWKAGQAIQRCVAVPSGEVARLGVEDYTIGIYIWEDDKTPTWSENNVYRLKPATKTVYEWMYRNKTDSKRWLTDNRLMDELDAKDTYSMNYLVLEYKKTGRSWEEEEV